MQRSHVPKIAPNPTNWHIVCSVFAHYVQSCTGGNYPATLTCCWLWRHVLHTGCWDPQSTGRPVEQTRTGRTGRTVPHNLVASIWRSKGHVEVKRSCGGQQQCWGSCGSDHELRSSNFNYMHQCTWGITISQSYQSLGGQFYTELMERLEFENSDNIEMFYNCTSGL